DNNGVFQLAFIFTGDRNREVGHAVNKIGGAIEGIDNPFVIRIFAWLGTAFLTANAVIGVSLAQMIDNFFFGRFIYFRDKVITAFGFDGEDINTLKCAFD